MCSYQRLGASDKGAWGQRPPPLLAIIQAPPATLAPPVGSDP